MDNIKLRVFIQARMSSSRFPEKVMAPFNGKPVIVNVIDRILRLFTKEQIVIATSLSVSDDRLASYVGGLGIAVFRGDLNNVFDRFQGCLKKYPCKWFFRICADSPLMDVDIIKRFVSYVDREDLDLVTNVLVRTFPKGHSVEMIKSDIFAKIDRNRLTVEEKEHITKFYYNYPREFKILNLESSDPLLAQQNFCVDTIEDLYRLEGYMGSSGNLTI